MKTSDIITAALIKAAGYAARTTINYGSTDDHSNTGRPKNYPQQIEEVSEYSEKKLNTPRVDNGALPQDNDDKKEPKTPWGWANQSISGTGGGPTLFGEEGDSDRFTGN